MVFSYFFPRLVSWGIQWAAVSALGAPDAAAVVKLDEMPAMTAPLPSPLERHAQLHVAHHQWLTKPPASPSRPPHPPQPDCAEERAHAVAARRRLCPAVHRCADVPHSHLRPPDRAEPGMKAPKLTLVPGHGT